MTPHAIEIVGGGLAGLSLGRLLAAANIPVTLFEAQAYPRHRVCGEFICGLRPEVESGLGLNAILHDACTHQTIGWHWKGKRIATNTLPRPAVGLSRHTLDARLAQGFRAAGGTLETRHRIRPTDTKPGRIWATGRRPGTGEWLGLKVHCRGLVPQTDLEFHFAPDAYVGVTTIENETVNVCGLFRRCADVRAPADTILVHYLRRCGLEGLADRVSATAMEGSHTAVAAISFDRHPPDDRLVLGDAHAMIPPFTGDGMAMALESAWLAADPLMEYARGRVSWEQVSAHVRDSVHHRFARRLAAAGILQRLMFAPIGQRGLAILARCHCLPFRLLFRWLH